MDKKSITLKKNIDKKSLGKDIWIGVSWFKKEDFNMLSIGIEPTP